MTDPPQRIATALLSVSDKTGLAEFASQLASMGVQLISTGGTARTLTEAGLQVQPIESLTGFPEMMDGRVKTLHPKVHGGLLSLRDKPEHAQAMREHAIQPIDLVCVNLYPFEKTVARTDVTDAQAIENIDIGGPTLIRSSAKNHQYVTCVTDPKQYEPVIEQMRATDGATTLELRRELAAAAFTRTAAYDAAISQWMNERGFNRPAR